MSFPVLVAIVVIQAIAFMWLGAYVATQKNREPVEGALLALCLSGLGVLIEALLPTRR